MPSKTIDTLRKHRKRLNEERLLMGNTWLRKWADLVFVSENGTPLDEGDMRRHVARCAKQADIAGHGTTRMIDEHYVHREQLTVSAAADLWDRDAD